VKKKMMVLPAIDLYKQKCVRLSQGKKETAKEYFTNPLKAMEFFIAQGAEFFHIIDLDAAFGEGNNRAILKKILKEYSVAIQVGGGIRKKVLIQELLSIGVERVLLGSYAITNLDGLSQIVQEFGAKRIVVAVDEKKEQVALNGWQKISKMHFLHYCTLLEEAGIERIVYTAITRDGLLKGPALRKITYLLKKTKMQVIASGGVGSLADIKALSTLDLDGVVVGRALYEKKFSLQQALEVVQNIS
jgi:phosphoribosylformimino-5-aminoimidazole carboxamide ribotide isomerase